MNTSPITSRSNKCYLIHWDHKNIKSNSRWKKYLFPLIEGFAPSRVSDQSLRMILQSIILTRCQASLMDKLNCSKSFSNGEPIFRRTHAGMVCTFTKLNLKAQIVENLLVSYDKEGKEKISWTEPTLESSDGSLIHPRRTRIYNSSTNTFLTT